MRKAGNNPRYLKMKRFEQSGTLFESYKVERIARTRSTLKTSPMKNQSSFFGSASATSIAEEMFPVFMMDLFVPGPQ